MSSTPRDVFDRVDDRVVIGGVPVGQVVESFGSPCLVFDAHRVRTAASRLVSTLAPLPSEVFYAVKAHANVEIIRVLAAEGIGVDACSPGDLSFAAAAGVAPERISFTAHAPSASDLRAALEAKAHITADSVATLTRIAAIAPGAQVGLRVNPGVVAGFHPAVQAGSPSSHFGLPVREVPRAVQQADALGLAIVGLHAHLGSDIETPDAHLEALELMVQATEALENPRFINLGGGFGVPFVEEEATYDFERFVASASRLIRSRSRNGDELVLRLEPGAFLMREAGFLVVSVEDVLERGGVAVVSVDAGVNLLPGAELYGAHHPVTTARTRAGGRRCRIVGNLMLAGDVLVDDGVLPTPVVGDHLVFGLCGAYTGARSSTFNQRPRPPEVVVDDGRARLTVRRETAEDLLARQVRPRS
jgi:diaminopimelate decarboxylase